MQSALRFYPGRRAAFAVQAAEDVRPRTLFWFAAFILLTIALGTLEIRSEALTVGALPRGSESGATQPRSYGPVVAATVVPIGQDKD